MKIENQNLYPLRDASLKPAAKPAGDPVKPDAVSSAFSVELSSAVERLKAGAQAEDDIRRDKIEAIRRQLASGTYNLSGKDVAKKILNNLEG